jgi:hypothetical protein
LGVADGTSTGSTNLETWEQHSLKQNAFVRPSKCDLALARDFISVSYLVVHLERNSRKKESLRTQNFLAKLYARQAVAERVNLATLLVVIGGRRRHVFLEIVISMTHLAIFWYLKREASPLLALLNYFNNQIATYVHS